MKKEIWKDITNYNGEYQVSNYCNIKSIKFGKEIILKLYLDEKKYLCVSLSKNGKTKNFAVHQLGCIEFLGYIPGGIYVVDHINGDKKNNFIGTEENNFEDINRNLHLVTQRENSSICYNKNRESFSSPLTGAILNKKNGKWRSEVYFNGRKYNLGSYVTDIEAHLKWKEATEAINNGTFNEFINLNSFNSKIKFRPVNQYTKSGEFIRTWNSINEACKELNIINKHISSCCNGKKNSACGFKWSYVNE